MIPLAWITLILTGPLVFGALFALAFGIRHFTGRHRRRERRDDLRRRRKRALIRAVENGGPSDAPRERYRSPDPNAGERRLFGKCFPGQIRGGWPRGRV